MSTLSKISHIRHLLAAGLLLSVLCACSLYDYGFYDTNPDPSNPQIATDNQYINLSIVVSAGNEGTTRADEKPAGGEDGDGREAGFERENKVKGITLMLYVVEKKEDNITDKGINDITNETLAFIQYYPVTLVDDSLKEQGTSASAPSKMIEAVYTTGDQSLGGSGLDLAKTYRAIVVANLDLTTIKAKDADTLRFKVGSKVKDVLDYEITDKIYQYKSSEIGAKADATEFVMSLESEDNTIISFQKPNSTTTSANGQTIEKFEFDKIRIERLAARVDFWTYGADYKDDNSTYETPGYEYKVYKTDGTLSGDKFVLTAITPFNLYNDNEFLFKRIGDGTNKYKYLASEDGMPENEVVLDPKTLIKKLSSDPSDPSTPSYLTSLATILDTNDDNKMQMSDFQVGSDYVYNYNEKPNIIVCYPKENTLLNSPLFYYATGLRIEGDYYEEGWKEETVTPNPKVKHLTYYGFLRHQGENPTGTYEIYSKEYLEENRDKLVGKHPMYFGVVRNNIYRISIDRITEKREVTWQIKVKKWDEFNHDIIYM